MSSDTEIANLALRLLKEKRITSLSDGSDAAVIVNDVFTETRDALLRSHNWNFATKRAQLAENSTAPTFEFDNAFTLPADWLRTISIHDNTAASGSVLYREEEVAGVGVIVSSADELWIRYVYRVTNPNRMPAEFRVALAHHIALACPGISNLSASDWERLEGAAMKKTRMAKHIDAMGSAPEQRPAGSWVTVRGGYPGWRAWPD